MAAPPTSIPCSQWTTPELVRECCSGLDPEYDLTEAIAFASSLLFRLSGRQWPGECTRTVWPCPSQNNCGCGSSDWVGGGEWWWLFSPYPAWPFPNQFGTGFVNVGRCSEKCKLERVKLPATVNSIDEVVIDGVTLDPSAYKIEAYRWLVRVDGEKWPCTNDLTGEPGDPGVWTITYKYGAPPPDDGVLAASIFACEIGKNRCGADCQLPQRLKQVTRMGMTELFPDPLMFLDKGQVGIYEVDLWLMAVNPSRLKRRARVHRADRGRTNTSFSG